MSFILKSPIMTEKNNRLAGFGIYVFRVPVDVKKPQIKAHVEKFFNVQVKSVNTLIGRKDPKRVNRRQPSGDVKYWKKAYVRLKKGQKLSLFESGA